MAKDQTFICHGLDQRPSLVSERTKMSYTECSHGKEVKIDISLNFGGENVKDERDIT
jgi:hypothetical protein